MALKDIIADLNKGEKLMVTIIIYGILKFNMFWKSKRFSRPLMLKWNNLKQLRVITIMLSLDVI